MSAAESPSPELLRLHQAGTTLANIAFNLAQRPGEPLTSDVVASLDACRREWDAACAAFKASRVQTAEQAETAQAAPVDPQWLADQVKNGIADFIGDNWPDRRIALADIEDGVRAIEVHANLIIQRNRATPGATHGNN